jgi:hypothetical protein
MILTERRHTVTHKSDSGVGFFDVGVLVPARMADPRFSCGPE